MESSHEGLLVTSDGMTLLSYVQGCEHSRCRNVLWLDSLSATGRLPGEPAAIWLVFSY